MAAIPEPVPGLVIGYAYLWNDEALAGRDEGGKDRPCVIVLAIRKEAERTVVTVAPITHSPPSNALLSIELPVETKRRLGLDDQRSWVVLHDLNQFVWPGPDLRPVSRGAELISYGLLPRSFYRLMRDRMIALLRAGRVAITSRAK